MAGIQYDLRAGTISGDIEGDTWMSLIMSGHMGSMWPSIVMLQQNTSTEQSALS
jgi:hypothetical protein